MPYINAGAREDLRQVEYVPAAESPGELNYLISTICAKYLDAYGTDYSTVNTIVGVLECAKLEFYRRVAVPYEDLAIRRNGDIEGYADAS